MKVAHLLIKVDQVGPVPSAKFDPGWIPYILDRGFDLVFYVDYLECHGGQPTTWALQKEKQPCEIGDKDISQLLPTRFSQPDIEGQPVSLKKRRYWFVNIQEKKDCSRELGALLLKGGARVLEVDISSVKYFGDIDAIVPAN